MSIRQAAKKANHGLNFAETYRTFALLNELEEREAKRIVYAYTCNCANFCRGRICKCAYPGVREWWDRTDAQLRKTRRITNCFGRTVYFMGQIGKDMFKQGYAFVPQSTTGDCCNHGMRAMFEDASPYFRPAELLAQVHDSLLVQYLSRNWTDMAAFAVKLGREYMRPELNYGEPYRLGTDLKVGFDWAAMIEVKLSDDVDAVAPGLAAAHDKLMGMKKAA